MNKHRVYSEPMEVWPPNIQLMVERGYFNPKEESPLKNHDWREDIVDKYNQMKSALKYGQPAGAAKLFTEMPLPSERPQGHSGDGRGELAAPQPPTTDAHPIEPRTGEAHGGQMDQGSPRRGGHRVAYLGQRASRLGPQAPDLPGGPHTPLWKLPERGQCDGGVL